MRRTLGRASARQSPAIKIGERLDSRATEVLVDSRATEVLLMGRSYDRFGLASTELD
jgi:hypothetical protein